MSLQLSLLKKHITKDDHDKAIEYLIVQSRPDLDFFLMTILAVLMAALGLLLDNTSVIIGSMLIAPLLWSILSLSMGIVMADFKLILRSAFTLIKAIGLAILSATVLTLFFSSPHAVLTSEIISRTQPSLAYAAIAIIAGLAASYALMTPGLNETLPGVAISVALIPPIANIGIGLALLNWNVIIQSFLLFLINTLGIIFASILIFSISNLYTKKDTVKKVLAKEPKDELA